MERLERRAGLAEDEVAELRRALAAAKSQIATLVGERRDQPAVSPPLADGVVGASEVKLDQLERAAKRKLEDASEHLNAAEREARSLLVAAREEAAAIVSGAAEPAASETATELERIRMITAGLRRLFDVKRDHARASISALSRRLSAIGVDGGRELEDLEALFGLRPDQVEQLVVELSEDHRAGVGRLD
jgi:hypothetical protein